MSRLFVIFIGSFFLFLNLHAQKGIMSEIERQELLAKSDSLFALGVELYDNGKFEEAIPIFAESDQIDKAVLDSTSNRRDYSAIWLASCYYQLGDTLKASETHKYYNVTPVDRRLTARSDSLAARGHIALDNGDLENALTFFEQCAEIEKSVVGEEHVWYLNTLSTIAFLYYNLARDNSSSGKSSVAIKFGTKAMNIYEIVYGKEHPDYANSLNNLAIYNYNLGNYSEAIRLGSEALNIFEKVYGTEHPDYATALNNLANYNDGLGNYSEAIRLGTEALNIREKIYGKEHPDYALSLSNLASYNYYLGNYSEAIRLCTEALNVREKVYGTEHPDYATSLNDLAYYNASLGNYAEAVRLCTEAMNIREKVFGKEHPKYAALLNNLASYNASLGNYSEAIRLGTEIQNIIAELHGEEHKDYAKELTNLAAYYACLGNYIEAVHLETKALNIIEKISGSEDKEYAELLNLLANYNAYSGNYAEAVLLETKSLNIIEQIFGTENEDYARNLHNLSVHKSNLGRYQEAIELCTEALKIREKIVGKEHEDYAFSLNALASHNADIGNYKEAIELCTEALKIRGAVLGKEHRDYATSLNNLAIYYSELGDYGEAIRLGTEALNIRKKIYGERHPIYSTSLNNLAVYFYESFHYKEAALLFLQVLDIRGETLGMDHPDYATALGNLASCYAALNNYNDALNLATQALNIREQALGKEHLDCASSLQSIAGYKFHLGDNEEAIELCNNALIIREKTYGKENPDYIKNLENLTIYNFLCEDKSSTNCHATQVLELSSTLIKNTFAWLTSSQRLLFWGKYSGWYEELIHHIVYGMPSDTLAQNGYNGVLLSKGLLLNSDIEFGKLIQESGDSEALAMYEDLKRMRAQVNKLREEYSSADSIKLHYLRAIVDSLSRESDRMEKDLVSRSKIYGDYTKNLVINWEQVQEKLTDKDIAVEFVSFPLNADSTMYIAYALKKDWECPKMIKLFEEKQLQRIRERGSVYGSDEVSRLVWKPLDEMMEGVENVYFAPGGELYNIAIESIPTHEDGGETLVGEHRDYYRLSSTRELALIKDKNNWQEAAVYGGLQYGMSVEDMIKDDAKYEKRDAATRSDSSPSYYVTREDREGRDVSVSVEIKPLSYLKGTLEEAIAIKEDLERQSVSTQLFTDNVGTETSFKNLHGRKTSIIHIGTHGFFNDRKKKHEENNLQLLGIDRQAKVIEDDALTRSGLYFAGADSARINGSSAIPDGIDDGKLTALEIAQLDLRGLDLIVLSACQTGLGEITGDGVFGLQRGFKKAGAQTIVMSLWKVDDKATTEFMTSFFENMKIEDGHPTNKYQAFKTAQEELRKNKDKYSDKNCWAAFVMLDGIR